MKEGRGLVATARSKGLRIGCAPDTFLGAGLQTCRGLIDSGAIGEPVAANAFMLSPGTGRLASAAADLLRVWRGTDVRHGAVLLHGAGVLLGPARRITSSARISRAERTIGSEPLKGQSINVQVPTHVASVVDFVSGPVATLVTSFDVQASRNRWIEIYGTEGTLAVPDPNTFGGRVQIKKHSATSGTTSRSRTATRSRAAASGSPTWCAARSAAGRIARPANWRCTCST